MIYMYAITNDSNCYRHGDTRSRPWGKKTMQDTNQKFVFLPSPDKYGYHNTLLPRAVQIKK